VSSVEIVRTTALFPSAVFIQWVTQSDETGTHLTDVYRAGAPNGPWEQIASSLPSAYHFLDDKFNLPPAPVSCDDQATREGLNLLSLSRGVFYKVTITPPSGAAAAFTSPVVPIEPGLDRRTRLFKRKILRDESVAFRRLNGIPIVILKRRHWGTRCKDCWDPGLREGTMEHCRTCYGTTYEGGYWDPVLVRGRHLPAPVQTQMTAHGMSDVKTVNFIILDFPMVEHKDIIINVRRNDRYVVQLVTTTELKSVPVHQTISASLVIRNATEYDIPVDPEMLAPLY
jgi:hypothetical protein